MNRLRQLRKEKGLYQIDIAKILGITSQSVSLYEADKRDMSTDTIIKLADFFNVSTDYLLGKEDGEEVEILEEDTSKMQNIVGNRIKQLREELGLTQERLANILELNAKSSIANYESGANAPSDEIKLKMCDLFNCTLDYLLGRTDVREEEESQKESMIVQNDFTDNEIAKKILKVFLDEKKPISAKRAEKIIDIAKSMIPDIANIYYLGD